ncbi:MAG: alpha-L-fucosidase [Promethearchaeota archaeon]
MKYKANKESLDNHLIPDWYQNAKLGIFIHWGLYSVPAWAPTEYGGLTETAKKGLEFHFAHNPYSEWYCNSMKLDGPYKRFHKETYGEEFDYDEFAPMFNDSIQKWNPDKWAEIFNKIHAKYVVLTTKHHDGFLLWPSSNPNPEKENYFAKRDLVGELTNAVRKKGLKMGFYYSSLFDWSFQPIPISDWQTFIKNGPDTPEYAKYVDNHWLELIDSYNPDILWSDIGYPPDGKSDEIIAYYYNKREDGIVNDRWRKISEKVENGESPPIPHYDFRTPEYRTYKEAQEFKFEVCRGIGRSFGYNRTETEEHHISVKDLVHLFVDIVSKNGNLLLDIGPTATCEIPAIQLDRLLGLGKWLDINGDAIFGTRPWNKAEGKTNFNDISVRFTQKEGSIYAILLGNLGKSGVNEVTIQDFDISDKVKINLLGNDGDLKWRKEGKDLTVELPDLIEDTPAITLKITLST